MRLYVAMALCATMVATARAQDSSPTSAASSASAPASAPSPLETVSSPTPLTTADPGIRSEELKLLLKPMTRAQLLIEANAWLALLQQKVNEESQFEVNAQRTPPPDKNELKREVAALKYQRTALVERLNIVLVELKLKGGATTEYEAYVKAVSSSALQLTDLAGAWLAFAAWLKSPGGGIRLGRNILFFLVTLLVFRVVVSISDRIARNAMRPFPHLSHLFRAFVVNSVRKLVFFVGIVIALSMLDVNIGPFLAAMGAAGFIIGFGLQNTLSNFSAGVLILVYRPFDIDDRIKIGDNSGVVTSLTLVSTVLRNDQEHSVIIPNSTIWSSTIINEGRGDRKPATA